jgi:DNA processing protein
MNDRTEQLLVLNAVPGLGPVGLRKLLSFCGSPEGITADKLGYAVKTGVLSAALKKAIEDFDRDLFLSRERTLMEDFQVGVMSWEDDDYPAWLKSIHDPPMVLYYRGNRQAFCFQQGVGIVGSRNASMYGISMAEQFAAQLAERGITIVSGLARGVDTAAHCGCLRGGGMTVAVLGCGLSEIYPAENTNLAKRISEKGLVISEFPMTAPPSAMHFPQRNRVISGLSRGLLVVEASIKSGALITAEFALEQGREVFALPGKIDTLSAAGSNRLIQQGAKMVTSIDDILEELAVPLKTVPVESAPEELPPAVELSESETVILKNIDRSPVDIDVLSLATDTPVQNIMNILLQLELKHLIKQLPGKRFVRV